MLVAACGSSSNTTGNSPTATPSAASATYNFKTPTKTGGTATFGEYEAVDTLNLLSASAEVDVKNINAMLDGCIIQLPDLTLGDSGWKPDQCTEVPLASNGDESADGMSTTMKLATNDVWSDGTPVTADDYIFYLDLLTDPNAVGDPYPFSQYFKSVTRVDDHTLTINWSSPFGPYLDEVSAIVPLPSHSFPSVWNSTTHAYTSPGTAGYAALSSTQLWNFTYPTNGAYKLQSHSVNSEVYVKNASFHSNFFKGPFLDQIVFKSEGDINTTVESFKTGQLNQADDFLVTQLPVIKGAGVPANETLVTPAISFEHADFNLRPQALNALDPNNTSKASIFATALVRKAFAESFNVCTALTAILADPNCHDPALFTAENTAAGAADFDPTVSLPAYNVAQAQTDLATAGFKGCKYSNGSQIVVNFSTTSGNATRAAYGNLAAAEWSLNLGCKVTITTIPSSTFFANYTSGGTLATGAFDIALFAYVDGTEPSLNDTTYQSTNIPGPKLPNGGNYQGINDPTIDGDVNMMLTTTGTGARNALAKSFQSYFTSQVYNIPLYIRANVGLATTNLENYLQNPGSTGNTWNIADWWLS